MAYLAELDERQLFLDLGFSSLFEYCVERLKLCESTAGRHIAAARVCRNYPQLFAMVASSALHASALSLLRKHLTSENAAELFELCTHRSARKVEELLAARFPRPDVRDLVRRLPRVAIPGGVPSPATRFTPNVVNVGSAAEQAPADAPAPEPAASLEKQPLESLSREPPTAPRPADAPKPRRLDPLSADRYGVHFTADGEFRELLERVRGLAGHRLPSGDLMTLLKRGLEAYERELEKDRFAVGRKSRRRRGVAPSSGALFASELPQGAPSRPDVSKPDLQPTPSPKRKRHCPAEVSRAVFLRDGKRCRYVSQDGRAVARDGASSSTTSNLGRWAVRTRSRIFGCAAELIINAMRGSTLVDHV